MQTYEVESSNIQRIGYDPNTSVLRVQFKSGTYDYSAVPWATAFEFALAPSKGKFLAREIKGKYQSSKLPPVNVPGNPLAAGALDPGDE